MFRVVSICVCACSVRACAFVHVCVFPTTAAATVQGAESTLCIDPSHMIAFGF